MTTVAPVMLGDLLGAARRDAGRFAAWLDAADGDLARRVRARVGSAEHPVSFARAAAAAFAVEAADADWVQLVSAARNADDPGLAALGVMVRWQMARDSG